jgi:hypothetical protein
MAKTLKIAVIICGSILISVGCGKRQTVVYNQPGLSQEGYYEITWIDPQVLISDPWYTLVRAERVDSFYVKEPSEIDDLSSKALEFTVAADQCFVNVNLLDDASRITRSLLAKNLSRGFYKLMFNAPRLAMDSLPPGNYYVRAEYCGFSVIQRLGRR